MLADIAALWRMTAWDAVVFGLLDILIVALIIYRVLLLIRGTRAAYMLCGMLAVGGVYLIAGQLSLRTVTWLLDHLMQYGLLIGIIVFQGDIRRGLLRMGRRLLAANSAGERDDLIGTLATCCGRLAAQRIGALIVIEREVELGDIVQPGLRLDARCSGELLDNIFRPWPDNPLHDGAVILRGERISEAGVVLPLSQDATLSRQWGTRHRAAVGISEESDALAIVVSEQRGSIGLAMGGALLTGLEPDTLERELELLLRGSNRESRPAFGWVQQMTRAVVLGERKSASSRRWVNGES
jgi:diadenylate cyclase